MAQPRKADLSKRRRWEVYVTPLERLRIEEGARTMGLPIGAAVARAFGGVQHVERADWREIVRLLTDVDRKMGEILTGLRERADPLDALEVAAALVSLDRAIRAQVMPWTLRDDEADELPELLEVRPDEPPQGQGTRARSGEAAP